MVNRIFVGILLLSASLCVFANKIEAYTVDRTLSPAFVSSIQSQWTLVQLWTLDCAVCERQKPVLSQLNKDYNELTVVGLSLDGLGNAESVRERLASKLPSFDNYIAELSSVKLQLQNTFKSEYVGTPTYILYAPNGKLVAVQPGPIDLNSLPQQLELTKSQALSADIVR